MRPNFFHHLHPPTIPAEQSRWRYTLGAGGAAIFLSLVLGLTGILEMFYYAPNPGEAALSIQTLSYHVPFGGLVRNLHYWAGQLLLVVSGLHLLRVVFTAAYHPPRRFNYLLGLALFVLVIMLNFTGYILRWDQDICWPLVTGTNLLKTVPLLGNALFHLAVGGEDTCASALLRFYTWHIFGLIIPAAILLGWHIFRLRRDGGVAVPPPQLRPAAGRISRFELARREALAMLIVGALLIALASVAPAPIAQPLTGNSAQLAAAGAEARAPWFFLWVQKMLQWGDPLLWGVGVPLAVLLALALLPFLPHPAAADETGRWFAKPGRPGQVVLGVITLGIFVLTWMALDR